MLRELFRPYPRLLPSLWAGGEGRAAQITPSPEHQDPPGRGYPRDALGVGQARPEPPGTRDWACETRGTRKPGGLEDGPLLLLFEPPGGFPVPVVLCSATFPVHSRLAS